jgi:predicted Rossmann-fold nucleotide-binding protein
MPEVAVRGVFRWMVTRVKSDGRAWYTVGGMWGAMQAASRSAMDWSS